MGIVSKRKGAFAIKVNKGDGNLVRCVIRPGFNDLDPEMVKKGLAQLPEGMAKAFEADLDFDAKPGDAPDARNVPKEPAAKTEDAPPAEEAPAESAPAEKLGAAEKAKLARAATSLEELRALAEGEERKTVTDAIDKRAAELEASA